MNEKMWRGAILTLYLCSNEGLVVVHQVRDLRNEALNVREGFRRGLSVAREGGDVGGGGRCEVSVEIVDVVLDFGQGLEGGGLKDAG